MSAPEKSSSLNAKQTHAVLLLLSGKRCKEVAEIVGVAAETISHWKRMPAFKAELNKIRLDKYETTIDHLWEASNLAVDTLTQLMQKSSPRVRLDAAIALLKLCKVDDRLQGMAHIGDEESRSLSIDFY